MARRRLIGLKTDQYALRATYVAHHSRHNPQRTDIPDPDRWQETLEVLPLGAARPGDPLEDRYELEGPLPENRYPEARSLARVLWQLRDEHRAVDLTSIPHLKRLVKYYAHGGALPEVVVPAWNLYREWAGLTPVQSDVLDCKLRGLPNSEIAKLVNARYNKTYSTNYISVVYAKQVLPSLAAAAKAHEEAFELLDQPKEWRHCSKCGALHPLIPFFWTRRGKGFVGVCKDCERKKRQRRNA